MEEAEDIGTEQEGVEEGGERGTAGEGGDTAAAITPDGDDDKISGCSRQPAGDVKGAVAGGGGNGGGVQIQGGISVTGGVGVFQSEGKAVGAEGVEGTSPMELVKPPDRQVHGADGWGGVDGMDVEELAPLEEARAAAKAECEDRPQGGGVAVMRAAKGMTPQKPKSDPGVEESKGDCGVEETKGEARTEARPSRECKIRALTQLATARGAEAKRGDGAGAGKRSRKGSDAGGGGGGEELVGMNDEGEVFKVRHGRYSRWCRGRWSAYHWLFCRDLSWCGAGAVPLSSSR